MPHLPWLTLLEGPTNYPSTSIWEFPIEAGGGGVHSLIKLLPWLGP